MRRRELLVIAGSLLVLPRAARSQGKGRRIGYLASVSAAEDVYKAEFLRGMEGLGYAAGREIALVERYADGKPERLPALAADLVQQNVDLIFASTLQAVGAAQKATATIPIVFVAVSDPVKLGFAESVRRPGRNLTGMSNFAGDLSPKRLELLQALLPKLARVALLANPDNPLTTANVDIVRAAGERVGLQVGPVYARTADEIESAFAIMARERAGAVLITGDVLHYHMRERITAAAAKYRIASIAPFREYADAGALASYGTDVAYQFRHAARYVDKSLKGAKPGELPVEQPSTFEFVINRATAKALGLTIPRSILLRADRVID